LECQPMAKAKTRIRIIGFPSRRWFAGDIPVRAGNAQETPRL
jgi:hypothetical protein